MRLPADVTVATFHRDDFRDTGMEVGCDRLTKLAAAGGITADHLDALSDHAKYLIMSLTGLVEDLHVQRTRSQLRHALMELLTASSTPFESSGAVVTARREPECLPPSRSAQTASSNWGKASGARSSANRSAELDQAISSESHLSIDSVDRLSSSLFASNHLRLIGRRFVRGQLG
jgi:hypothetical protein